VSLALKKPGEVRLVARSLARTLQLVFTRGAAGEYTLARIE